MADTIFALATPPGRSGIAVIRLSGAAAFSSAAQLGAGPAPARRAMLRRLRDPVDGGTLDDALVVRFEAPASYTGEDVVELHVHGGPAVCRSIDAALSILPGLRPAQAGEFTRRALLNGKLDLSQVEGVGDLLAAETAAQARQALDLVDGALSAQAAGWREGLVRALALIEASIDFADEDLPADVVNEARALLLAAESSFASEIAGSVISERLREGFEVALIGAPNVGKSTLLNRLAGREAALTSEIAGTTRDVIEVRMDLAGLPVTLIDTAGLRDTDDPVEVLGVERARQRAAQADVRVFLLGSRKDIETLGIDAQKGDQLVLNKADCRQPSVTGAVSGLTGAGINDLLQSIAQELSRRVASAGLLNRRRHRLSVERALTAVREARGSLDAPQLEVAATEIQAALRALDSLVGKVDIEDVLDVVFRSFCIGK